MQLKKLINKSWKTEAKEKYLGSGKGESKYSFITNLNIYILLNWLICMVILSICIHNLKTQSFIKNVCQTFHKKILCKNIQTNIHNGSHPETSKIVNNSYPIEQGIKMNSSVRMKEIFGINVWSFLNGLLIA